MATPIPPRQVPTNTFFSTSLTTGRSSFPTPKIPLQAKSISILEIGFGTGLNAFITFVEAKKTNQSIDYVGVEAYPVEMDETMKMNYPNEIDVSETTVFKKMHEFSWDLKNQLSDNFMSNSFKNNS